MTTVAVRKDETEIREALRRVQTEGERVLVEEDGHPVGALVSLEDLKALEELEDRRDELAALEALAESDERIRYKERGEPNAQDERKAFLRLPIAERRRILAEQAAQIAAEYERDTSWQDLGPGDFVAP